MLPIDPNEIYDAQALRDRIASQGLFTSDYKAKCQARLEQIIASNAASAQRIADAKRHAKENAVGYKKKPKGKIDSRSVKHSSTNAIGAGGIAAVGAGVHEAFAIYDDFDSHGMVPDASAVVLVLKAVTDWGLVIVIVAMLVGGLTLVMKALKEY